MVERPELPARRAILDVHVRHKYVEDNPSNLAFMQDLLADFERVELLTAPTAEIGIELVRGRRSNVVITDVNLPGVSGFEATRKLAACSRRMQATRVDE
jgi:CheY-like chemotaxis protein